ncbi:MAG: ATP-binding cassette domain-containing protein [Amaricoccus sp.]|uniref:ATP-binding cassette domain-containing protein n=1 Tax=Amaricoccus sp. TaxID=1872485 RepID=UPI003314C249
MADDPIIRLRGITKTYGTGATAFQALKGVDLDIARGDFVAVMGPSGSGKSTAMNILGCLDRPTAGEYLFHGHHVETLDRDQRALLRRRAPCRARWPRRRGGGRSTRGRSRWR